MMIAEYDNEKYEANVKPDNILLLTYVKEKAIEGFEPKRDYYKKQIALEDEKLKTLYDISYFVQYKDGIEEKDIWYTDEGQAAGLISNVENDEITIYVNHSAKDESWIQYERGYATKRISLFDCADFVIEKTYIKKDGKIVKNIQERVSVSLDIFKESMVVHRRSNL